MPCDPSSWFQKQPLYNRVLTARESKSALLLVRSLARAHVMKQILLRVTGIGSEISGYKLAQPLRARSTFWKVKLPQRFHHPDIHRKGRGKIIGKEQDAIGDLRANSLQFGEPRPRLLQG